MLYSKYEYLYHFENRTYCNDMFKNITMVIIYKSHNYTSISINVIVEIEMVNILQRTMETFYKYHCEMKKSKVKLILKLITSMRR